MATSTATRKKGPLGQFVRGEKKWTRPKVTPPPSAEYALNIHHECFAGWEQWYLLISDVHWDSPECYLRLVHRHLKQAKERNALIIDGGDFNDVISARNDPRGNKSTLRLEHSGRSYLDRVVDGAVEEFAPYADLFTYMGYGNHDENITARYETNLMSRIVEGLNAKRSPGLPPIHHAGYTGWIRFYFALSTIKASHLMKIEHGVGGNSPVTKGVIQSDRRMSRTEGASFFVSGHIHEKFEVPRIVEAVNDAGRIVQREVKHLQLGSYKMDFRPDGKGTWAMQKMGNPKPIGGTWLRFYSPDGRRIMSETIATEVDYENLTDYLSKARVFVEPNA